MADLGTPELVTTEIPEEVMRMEAALQRERQGRAANAARDAEIAAAINNDIFFDMEPVSGGAPITVSGMSSTPLDDIKDIDVDLYSNKDIIDQSKHTYNIEVTHSLDHNGNHYWCFDDRVTQPFVIITFRTRKNVWMCIINDNVMPLSKFLSITDIQIGAPLRREFGAPANSPVMKSLICKTSNNEEFTIQYAYTRHIVAALQNIPEDPGAYDSDDAIEEEK
jgi:hypothetical protein